MDTNRRALMLQRDAALASGDLVTFQRLTTALAKLPMKGVKPLTQRDIDRYAKRHAS
jgi:hypothetical protein